MNCPKCHKVNPKDSNFCQQCGVKLAPSDGENVKDKQSDASLEVNTPVNNQNFWDKFIEVYDSSGETREAYLKMTSNVSWTFIENFSTNIFEHFIEENKVELNKQFYKLIESLKNNFIWCSFGGYWLWLTKLI